MVARLTEKPGASDYVKGGIVVYENDAKVKQAGVPGELIERYGAVSAEVAGHSRRSKSEAGCDVGVGVTGIAGPGGGTAEKPVGLVWLSVVTANESPSPARSISRAREPTYATGRRRSRCTSYAAR